MSDNIVEIIEKKTEIVIGSESLSIKKVEIIKPELKILTVGIQGPAGIQGERGETGEAVTIEDGIILDGGNF